MCAGHTWVTVICVCRSEVRCGGGCRGTVGTGRRSATGATARWPPGFSLAALEGRGKVVLGWRGLWSEHSHQALGSWQPAWCPEPAAPVCTGDRHGMSTGRPWEHRVKGQDGWTPQGWSARRPRAESAFQLWVPPARQQRGASHVQKLAHRTTTEQTSSEHRPHTTPLRKSWKEIVVSLE